LPWVFIEPTLKKPRGREEVAAGPKHVELNLLDASAHKEQKGLKKKGPMLWAKGPFGPGGDNTTHDFVLARDLQCARKYSAMASRVATLGSFVRPCAM
jgi:hypothetical protein